MKIIVLFFISFIFLLTIILGYFLSKKIINRSELLVFWMLYIITISTVMTIFCSVYINYDIRNLKGPPGEQGIKGNTGELGEDGLCESNCKDMIPYKSILNAIERRLYELENQNKPQITDTNRKLYEELKGLKLYYNNIEKDKPSIAYIEKDEQLKQMYSNIFGNELDESKIIKLDNPFFKETIKRIVQSYEYKQLEPIRGNIQLLDYVKFIFLSWVDLIYEQVGINYFKTIGAENDLDRLKTNPFDEIKEYDIYNWGYSNSYKPKLNETKSLFASKKQLEQFTNLYDLRKPEKGIDIKNEPKKLKILRTNDYMMSYNDKGSYLSESINCYRPKSVKHQGDIYYPLGDICVPEKHKSDKKIFGNLSSSVSKEKSMEKPNRDTILVAGDVKKPLGYNTEWIDLQVFRHDVHGDGLFGGGNNRYGYHRGRIYSLECPTGYKGIGIIGSSTRNVPEEIKKHTDETGDNYYPKGNHTPVCLPQECVEELDRDKFKEIWNTADSNKGYTKVFGVRKQVQYRTLFSKTDTTDFVTADHSNAYNLSDMKKTNKSSEFYRIKDECITKEEALPYYDSKYNLWKTDREDFKNYGVIENFKNEIDLGGDDFQWPTLTKDDKTGEKDEDKLTMYISVKKDKETVLNAINDSNLKTFIKEYDNKFYEKNNYSNDEIIKLKNKIDEIIMNIKTYSKKDLQITIGFYDSISKNIKKYKDVKSKLENLYKTYTIIYGSKIQNEDDLGLGWNETKQKELDNMEQSMHNFLYIDDYGILEDDINKNMFLFNKISPGVFTLKRQAFNNTFYIFATTDHKINSKTQLPLDLKNNIYHFKLILSNKDNSKGQKYYIKSLSKDKYIYYNEKQFILSDKKSLFTLKKN